MLEYCTFYTIYDEKSGMYYSGQGKDKESLWTPSILDAYEWAGTTEPKKAWDKVRYHVTDAKIIKVTLFREIEVLEMP